MDACEAAVRERQRPDSSCASPDAWCNLSDAHVWEDGHMWVQQMHGGWALWVVRRMNDCTDCEVLIFWVVS